MAQCNATKGCAGQIVDGYCDQCGSAPVSASPAPQPAPAQAQAAPAKQDVSASATCSCGGKFVDGFCDNCGNAPVAQSAAASTATGLTGRTGSTFLSGKTSGSKRSTRSGRLSSTRRQLGLGLVTMPDVPKADPLKALMADAQVPPNKRVCAGYQPDGNPCGEQLTKREKGFCPKCRTPYNYVPGLDKGEMVAGQYEVAGCIAFGGMGWIYLAKDVTLNRYVVLKGLVNQSDKSAADAAVAERQFLAEVKHPNIVGVYTCVQHTNTKGSAAYTVMEYVGGKTLKSLRKERGPLPIPEVLAYMHRTLGAFGYMHANGLIYNDFKPDNVMLEDGDIKVIDLGGVCRANHAGDIYSTTGYAPPELGTAGPSFSSDLYTIGRTIAVLATEFKGFQSTCEHKLKTPAEEPLYAKYESFYRFLLKATHQNPNMRFQSAEEMSEQLVGVLREVVALDSGTSHPAESTVFGQDTLGLRDRDESSINKLDIESLPSLKMDPNDPATTYILTNLGTGDPARQTPILQHVMQQIPESIEALLAMARNQLLVGKYDACELYIAEVEKKDPFDWRCIWYRGLSLIAQGKPKDAVQAFDTCYSEVPGELAPKLGIAIASELSGDSTRAATMYEAVARTDSNCATALVGLARVRAAGGARGPAVDALARIPQTSSLYVPAQKMIARTLMADGAQAPAPTDLEKAAATIDALVLQGMEKVKIVRELFGTALQLLEKRAIAPTPAVKLMGQELSEGPVRRTLEQSFRDMAKLTTDPNEKVRLIDQANKVRPVTLV